MLMLKMACLRKLYVQSVHKKCLGSQKSTSAIADDSSEKDQGYKKGELFTSLIFIEHLPVTIISFSSTKEDQEIWNCQRRLQSRWTSPTSSIPKSCWLFYKFQTGEPTENAGLITRFKMGDQANATQLQMRTRRALAVPPWAGAETVMITAIVMDAKTSGRLVSRFLLLSASPLSIHAFLFTKRQFARGNFWD